jgi:glycosyltransferase involved in cell wall biosynthesis
LHDIKGFADIVRLVRNSKASLILPYTIKPVIYSCLVARLFPRLVVLPLITGAGIYFTAGSKVPTILRFVVRRLYRIALRRANAVIFQNQDDRDLFVKMMRVKMTKTRIINGSGVHLDEFPESRVPIEGIRILMISRLLRSKGIIEYLSAAKICRGQMPDVQFILIGPTDSSPDGIGTEEFDKLVLESGVQYLGFQSDVRPELEKSTIVVLPSYREGIPRSILEALATGRPIIVTDVPGCRETVEHGVNGLLVPAKDANALAAAILQLAASPTMLGEMGQQSRKICMEKFDVHKVNESILRIATELLKDAKI